MGFKFSKLFVSITAYQNWWQSLQTGSEVISQQLFDVLTISLVCELGSPSWGRPKIWDHLSPWEHCNKQQRVSCNIFLCKGLIKVVVMVISWEKWSYVLYQMYVPAILDLLKDLKKSFQWPQTWSNLHRICYRWSSDKASQKLSDGFFYLLNR